tara:strand:+ start:59 stop:337 length:279 start_codon:yes stop_codon:yes gene_type:complete
MSAVAENEVVSTQPTPQPSSAQQAAAGAASSDAQQQANLLNVEVKNENDALNVMAGFLQVAQRRGAYSLAEAAKIMDCIKFFGKAPATTPSQ